jgi:hypothetical protein
MTNKLVVIINSLKYKLQLSPETLTKGLPPPDPRSLCPLSSTEFVEPPEKKFLGTPLVPGNNPSVSSNQSCMLRMNGRNSRLVCNVSSFRHFRLKYWTSILSAYLLKQNWKYLLRINPAALHNTPAVSHKWSMAWASMITGYRVSCKNFTKNLIRMPSVPKYWFFKYKYKSNIFKNLLEFFLCWSPLCYKPEVRGFDSRWCHWNFSWT